MENKHPHIGSSFDDFLAEQGIREQVNARALKRVIAWQLSQATDENGNIGAHGDQPLRIELVDG